MKTIRRITITGNAGSGKTTLAVKIAQHYDIPVIHLDKYFWKPGWEMPDMDEWRDKVEELAQGESWVMEGNYGSTFDIRFPRATQIIHMDFSRYVCLYRVIKRSLQAEKKVRYDMAPGCQERLEWDFCKYVWNYPKINGPRVYKNLELYDVQDKFQVLKNKNDISRYLNTLY